MVFWYVSYVMETIFKANFKEFEPRNLVVD